MQTFNDPPCAAIGLRGLLEFYFSMNAYLILDSITLISISAYWVSSSKEPVLITEMVDVDEGLLAAGTDWQQQFDLGERSKEKNEP